MSQEPSWEATIGNQVERGQGRLSRHLALIREGIDCFTLFGSDYRITVKPKLGQIWTDSRLDTQTEPGALFWGMRREIILGTHDRSSAPPRTIYWKLGIEHKDGKTGWKINLDGTATKGI